MAVKRFLETVPVRLGNFTSFGNLIRVVPGWWRETWRSSSQDVLHVVAVCGVALVGRFLVQVQCFNDSLHALANFRFQNGTVVLQRVLEDVFVGSRHLARFGHLNGVVVR